MSTPALISTRPAHRSSRPPPLSTRPPPFSTRPPPPPFTLGRWIALALCVVFAAIGSLPLAAGFVVRSAPVKQWASNETERALYELLGVHADYTVDVQLWPLELALHRVTIASTDGGAPALRAERIAVTPRLFALIAGKLDIGDIEVEGAKQRLVFEDGKLVNLTVTLPESKSDTPELERAPFSSLSITDAEFDIDYDEYQLRTGNIDLDVFAERGWVFDVALRMSESTLTSTREGAKNPFLDPDWTPVSAANPQRQLTFDEDVLCQLDLRAHFEPGEVTVRRLSLRGAADLDPEQDSRPSCSNIAEESGQVALRLARMKVRYPGAEPDAAPSGTQNQAAPNPVAENPGVENIVGGGHVIVRAPLNLVNRFTERPFLGGWVSFNGDALYDSGKRLPELHGKLKTSALRLNEYNLLQYATGEVHVVGDSIELPKLVVGHSDGTVTLTGTTLEPFAEGIPILTRHVDIDSIRFPGLMRDVDVTRHTIVNWDISSQLDNFGGTLDPLRLDGHLRAQTQNFEVFDRGFDDPGRRHIVGVKSAQVTTQFAVRSDSIQFLNSDVRFGNSHLFASVIVGFDNSLELSVDPNSKLSLEDISPLVDIPMSGMAEVSVSMSGPAKTTPLLGKLSIEDFDFAGFPLGDVESSDVEFLPLKLDVKNLKGKKGGSHFTIPTGQLNFDTEATLIAEGRVISSDLDLRDFFAMWHFDKDPRWESIRGQGSTDAYVTYVMGGRRDPCKNGNLHVAGALELSTLEMFEELYDSGEGRFDFRWQDMQASYLGMQLEVPNLTLRKGPGRLFGSGRIDFGGKVAANAMASGVPLRKIQAMGALGQFTHGSVNAVAELGGTLDALTASVHTTISPVHVGGASFGGGQFTTRLVPIQQRFESRGKTQCGRPIPPEFDPGEFAKDESFGVFHVDGRILGEQVALSDFQVTRQRRKTASGKLTFNGLDIGPLLSLRAGDATTSATTGRLTGELQLDRMALDNIGAAEASFDVSELWFKREGTHFGLMKPARFSIGGRRMAIPKLGLAIKTEDGTQAVFDAEGELEGLGRAAAADLKLVLRPTKLSTFRSLFNGAEELEGELAGSVNVKGPLASPQYSGGFSLKDGTARFQNAPLYFTDVNVDVALASGELRVTRGTAKAGGGTISLTGSLPLIGTRLGEARGLLKARSINVPLDSGIDLGVDADLQVTFDPSDPSEDALPRLVGLVTIKRFEYTRPIKLAADIGTLAKRGRRTAFQALDLEDEVIEFDIKVIADGPLRVENNLIQAAFRIEDAGLQLEGTNQRYGIRGRLDIDPGGNIRLRRSDFEIRQGELRFDDPTKIAPRVDLTAETDYRRYSSSGVTGGASTEPASSGTGTTSGQWRITLHAYGDAESPRIDLSSQPELSQDDIFLLLTLGLTRTELDQAQSASLGESVALEALGTLTGADQAVTDALPVIDDFQFGSAYSARTGRTEPTVIIGKRLTRRIRAFVTSGITESREVRSNVEWRLNNRVSVEGSYDNVNDISSSSLGNLGADIRWRLEFE